MKPKSNTLCYPLHEEGHVRILWFDPEAPAIPRMMKWLLRPHGITVDIPLTGPAYFHCLKEASYALLLVDETALMSKPTVAESSILSVAREHQPGIPIVITGTDIPEQDPRLIPLNEAPLYLTRKPFDPDKVIFDMLTFLQDLPGIPSTEGLSHFDLIRFPENVSNGKVSGAGSLQGMRILYADYCCPELGSIIARLAVNRGSAEVVECVLSDTEAARICETQSFDLIILDLWCLTDKMAAAIHSMGERTGSIPELVLIGGSLPRELVEKPPWNRALFTLIKPFELAAFFESVAGFWEG